MMRAIGFLSFYDRLAAAPMLVVLATQMNVSLTDAIRIVSAYALLYALGQPLWGLISDRYGRVPVLRVALVGTIAATAASVMAVNLPMLILARAVAGLFVGSLFPTLLTILGDSYTASTRAREISSLQVFTALGATFATLIAGVPATWTDWRVVFAITGVGAAWLVVQMIPHRAGTQSSSPERSTRSAFSKWPIWLYMLALLEGGILQGILTYIVPALEYAGLSLGLAGLIGSAYGLGIIGGAALTKRLVSRIGRTAIIGTGVGVLIAAFAAATASQGPAALAMTSLFLGISNALLHSSLQGWVTDIAPHARATAVSIFVCCLFLGSSLATSVTAPFTVNGYSTIFAMTFAVSIVLVLLATGSHWFWSRPGSTDTTGWRTTSRADLADVASQSAGGHARSSDSTRTNAPNSPRWFPG
ncbi:MFS transporter [Rhodococcus pseudokoreensis]|uniref:MFS transporter n=1 Tax=Rhodococcus pseudokoreensis TaxID=2811421 RepID=A0A974W4U3_9NOCA|nr:MFS transporter [Rhodococcus pseudokoreensis]QSE90637.1 MFS transporter [Rhodococcus pseudokoreensis]